MTTLEKHNGGNVNIDQQAVLRSLNLNPSDPKTQALLLVCEKYSLDPVLKHMVLIQGNPYVTRDGYLAIAHRSGVFDGMEVLEQTTDSTHYVAKVAVYRKDMNRPFTFIGRFPKSKHMAKEYGPEMAVKVAEVQALRRAFNVTGVGAADERWDAEAQETTVVPENVDTETGEVKQLARKRPSPLNRKDASMSEITVGGNGNKTQQSNDATVPTDTTVEEPLEAELDDPNYVAPVIKRTKAVEALVKSIKTEAQTKHLSDADLNSLVEEHTSVRNVDDIVDRSEGMAVLTAIGKWNE